MGQKAFAASDAEWCYHDGELVKMGDVRLSPATHALNYGTGVSSRASEGIGTRTGARFRSSSCGSTTSG